MGRRHLPLVTFVCALAVFIFNISIYAQSSTGVVTGHVADASTGEPLPGAEVVVNGSLLSTTTDLSGDFRLVGVPAGSREVTTSYLGHRTETATVMVTAGATTPLDVKLAIDRFEESVAVTPALIADAQA